MNLETLYNNKINVFTEGVSNISVGDTELYFEYHDVEVTINTKDLRTLTLFTDDWQHTIRHWVFK